MPPGCAGLLQIKAFNWQGGGKAEEARFGESAAEATGPLV